MFCIVYNILVIRSTFYIFIFLHFLYFTYFYILACYIICTFYVWLFSVHPCLHVLHMYLLFLPFTLLYLVTSPPPIFCIFTCISLLPALLCVFSLVFYILTFYILHVCTCCSVCFLVCISCFCFDFLTCLLHCPFVVYLCITVRVHLSFFHMFASFL